MLVTGISLPTFTARVAAVSAERYAGNLAVHPDSAALSPRRFRARVRVLASDGPGARRSWSGRRGPYACWHSYRDAILEIFAENDAARVQTSLATYRGLSGFLTEYPPTGDANIGSVVAPVTMPELCDCSDVVRETTLWTPVDAYA